MSTIGKKRAEFSVIVVDASSGSGSGSAKLFHEAFTEANVLLVPVAAARNERDVTAHVVFVKADDRTSLPHTAKDKLPEPGEGIGPDRDEPSPSPRPYPLLGALHGRLRQGPTELSGTPSIKELTA